VAGETSVPDRVDATVDAVEAARLDPRRDCALAEPDRLQLSKSDDAMLPLRELPDGAIPRGSRKIVNA
jgi:hypothetical protein